MNDSHTVRIRGVTGFGHWHWLERRAGRSSWTQSQIRQISRGYTTPWIDQKHHYYSAYCNALYLRSVRELEPLVRETASMVAEQKSMNQSPLPACGGCPEEQQRLTQARAARTSAQIKRRAEILVRLAEIRSEVDNRAQALEHLLAISRDKLEAHIAAYWSGVLTVTDESLPATPATCPEPPGKARYETYCTNLQDLLEQGLREEAIL